MLHAVSQQSALIHFRRHLIKIRVAETIPEVRMLNHKLLHDLRATSTVNPGCGFCLLHRPPTGINDAGADSQVAGTLLVVI